jgi:short-subunit dehydrogenase
MAVALVTGASSGIGAEFARQLARTDGVEEVWVLARRRDRLEALELDGARKVVVSADLRLPAEIESVLETLGACRLPVRFLVNSAGYGKIGPLIDRDRQDQLGMIDINARALTHLTHGVLPLMEPGGVIFNVGSMAGYFPMPGMAVYAATKAYVLSFSVAVDVEARKRRVRCVAVTPGPVRTEFHTVATPDGQPGRFQATTAQTVVTRALRDAARGRSQSITGLRFRVVARMLARILPRRWTARLVDRLSF